MTWKNQIQSSKYIKGVATCTGLQNTDVPTQVICPNGDGTFNFGGRGKGTALATGSSQHFLNVYSGAAGSAAEVYSSDKILLQKAGRQYCAELITDQDAYTIFPSCTTVNTNGPTASNPNPSVNNQDTNPYLPAFDTYYKFKNPPAPTIDQNQKHFVQSCNGCVVEPVVTRYGWPLLMVGTSGSLILSNSVTYNGDSVFVAGTFSGTINVFDGTPTQPSVTNLPTITMTSATSNLDAFLIKYDQYGKIQWFTTIQTINGTQTTAYSVVVDGSGVYVSGYMDGTINCYHGISRDLYLMYGPVVSTLSSSSQALFILKYTLSGYLQWANMVDGIQNQSGPNGPEIQPTNMSQMCSDGTNLYVCNSIDSTVANVTVYASDGSSITMSDGGANNTQQGFLVQYNAMTGMINWGTRVTGDVSSTNGSSSSVGLVCDSTQVYMTGYFNTTVTSYDAITPANQTFGAPRYVFSNGINNGMYIIAYNKSGVVQWANHGSISNFTFNPMGIQLTADASGIYVLVPFPDVISLNTTPQPPGNGNGTYKQLINTGGPSTYNIGIVKYSLSGSLLWLNKILNVDNNSGNIYTNGFSLSSDGSALYVTGGFGANTIGLYNSSTSGDPSPQVATLNTAGGTNMNTFLVKYNLLGAIQWSTIIGHAASFAYGYSVNSNTNVIYVTGAANGPVDVYNTNGLSQPTVIGTSLNPGAGAYFYTYVAKYDYNGKVLLG